MLELLEIDIDDVVAYRLDGRLSDEDMKAVVVKIKAKLAEHGSIGLYQEVISIGAIEFDAMIEKMKFIHDVGISSFKKIAIITDKRWMQKIVPLEDKLFKHIDMRAFSLEQRDQALDFLRA